MPLEMRRPLLGALNLTGIEDGPADPIFGWIYPQIRVRSGRRGLFATNWIAEVCTTFGDWEADLLRGENASELRVITI